MQWLKADNKRVMMILQDLYSVTFMNRLASEGLTGYANTGYSGPGVDNAVGVKFGRKVNGGDIGITCDNNKLYDFLFRSGPFTINDGAIDPEEIFLCPFDNINHALIRQNCPNTMIPLIMDETNQYILLGGVTRQTGLFSVEKWNCSGKPIVVLIKHRVKKME